MPIDKNSYPLLAQYPFAAVISSTATTVVATIFSLKLADKLAGDSEIVSSNGGFIYAAPTSFIFSILVVFFISATKVKKFTTLSALSLFFVLISALLIIQITPTNIIVLSSVLSTSLNLTIFTAISLALYLLGPKR